MIQTIYCNFKAIQRVFPLLLSSLCCSSGLVNKIKCSKTLPSSIIFYEKANTSLYIFKVSVVKGSSFFTIEMYLYPWCMIGCRTWWCSPAGGQAAAGEAGAGAGGTSSGSAGAAAAAAAAAAVGAGADKPDVRHV